MPVSSNVSKGDHGALHAYGESFVFEGAVGGLHESPNTSRDVEDDQKLVIGWLFLTAPPADIEQFDGC